MFIKFKFSFLLLLLFPIGCGGGGETTYDPSGNQRIAQEAGKFLYGCPNFFLPPGDIPGPGVMGSDPYQQNLTSAVAWCPTILVGNPLGPPTKNGYIGSLNLAAINNQTSWYDYQEINGNPPSGYPGFLWGGVYYPSQTYQNGFVCYALVYRAILDAGFNPFITIPGACNTLTN